MKKSVMAHGTSDFTVGDLRAHRRLCRTVAGASSFLMLLTASAPAFAGTAVLGGDATLTGATGANLAQNADAYAQFVSTGGASAVLDWSKFNVGAGKEMNFDGASTTFFNLVDASASKSQVDGIISGNGSVWVINPNGIAFGAGSQVNVGGLFAAAASGVENADDLRSGTATLPVLSRMSGAIEIGAENEASHFSGDRCLLIGNVVSADNADFSTVGRTTIEGVGYVTLESLEGGLVKVRASDFRFDDTGVSLGDLQASGILQVVANGDMSIHGNVSVAGTAVLKTADGDITVSKGATVSVSGEKPGLEMSAGNLTSDYLEHLQLDDDFKSGVVGNVNIHGKVVLSGDSGQLYIRSGAGVGAKGDLVLDGEIVSRGNNDWIDLRSGYGHFSEGNIEMSGNLYMEGNRNVGVLVAGNGGYSKGHLNIEGEVSVKGDGCIFEMDAANGYCAQGEIHHEGSVRLEGDSSQLAMFVGAGDDARGNIDIAPDAEIIASGGENLVRLMIGYGEGAKGSLMLEGTVRADEGSRIVSYAGYGSSSEGKITIGGNVESKGDGGSICLNAGSGDGSKGSVVITKDGILRANGVGGRAEIIAGEGNAAEGDVLITGKITADGVEGSVKVLAAAGDDSVGDVTIAGIVSADGNRETSVRDENVSPSIIVGAANGARALGNVRIGGVVHADGDNGSVIVGAGTGTEAVGVVNSSGTISADGDQGTVEIDGGYGFSSSGAVVLSGGVTANGKDGVVKLFSGYGDAAVGNVEIGRTGRIEANGENAGVIVVAAHGNNSNCNVTMDGTMSSEGEDGAVVIVAGLGERTRGDVNIGGMMRAQAETQVRTSDGNISVSGSLVAEGESGHAAVWAVGSGKATGNIAFKGGGSVSSGNSATIVATGNITQEHSSSVLSMGGYIESISLPATVLAETVYLRADGNVGSVDTPIAIDGAVYGVIGGDAMIAAADAGNFRGGGLEAAPTKHAISSVQTSIDSVDLQGVTHSEKVIITDLSSDFSALGGTASLLVEGDLSIYTAGTLEANGLLVAGGDLTVSAASFGDMSYLQAGGTLTINNVGKPAHPQVAYFESVDGVEPKINNQPNDTVIFVDGRLAGGNLRILNQFGANEAFLVQTPELKSTQGIFGNPTFLHSDLDVANPMEVSAIDYMLQETPRLTLDKDFPQEADRHVDSVVIPEKDSIQFGREAKNESAAASDNTVAMAM